MYMYIYIKDTAEGPQFEETKTHILKPEISRRVSK